MLATFIHITFKTFFPYWKKLSYLVKNELDKKKNNVGGKGPTTATTMTHIPAAQPLNYLDELGG